MAAKSKNQYRFMKAVAHGRKPSDSDITPDQAKEFVGGQGKKSYKKLPAKKTKKGKKIKKEFPVIGADKRVVAREDNRGAKLTEPKKPGGPKIEMPKPASSIRGTLIRSEEQDQVEKLLKAYERRDDYTLVDPREFYGALQTVNKRVLGWVQDASKGLEIGDARDFSLPVEGATLKIRKLAKDMYSGHIIDKAGNIEHLYDRLTLPALATQIMSVYEVYGEEQPQSLRTIHDELAAINQELKAKKKGPRALKERLHKLIDNLARIDEMVTDHQEKHIGAHNKLVERTESEINNIHQKLKDLRNTFNPNPPEVEEQPDVMTVRRTGRPGPCSDCGQSPCQCYVHLTKPCIEVEPSGKVTIMFKSDWNPLDKVNFLKSMKYVMEKKEKRGPIISNPIHLASHIRQSPYRGTHEMVSHALLGKEPGVAGIAFTGIRANDFKRGAHQEWALRQQKKGNQTHMTPDPESESRVYISSWRKKPKE